MTLEGVRLKDPEAIILPCRDTYVGIWPASEVSLDLFAVLGLAPCTTVAVGSCLVTFLLSGRSREDVPPGSIVECCIKIGWKLDTICACAYIFSTFIALNP